MTGRKVEFIVEQSDELHEAPNELKAGTRVTLINDHSSGKAQIHCEGQLLGQVPVEQQQQLGGRSCTCSLRSIRKQDGKVTQILVTAVLSNSQAKSLPVKDDSLRGMLKDERLQKEILAVDTADDREKALQQHFQSPDFKAFTDKVLGIVAAN